MSLYRELKRRNVFRVAIAYLAGSWLLIEVAETIFPLYGFGDTPARIVVTLLAIGFPLFLIFSWVFEVTPEGLKLEKDIKREESITPQTGKKLDRIIIMLLALALSYFAVDKFLIEPARDAELLEETAQQARAKALVESYGDNSIAVLPFVNMSPDPKQDYFSDGVSEELLNVLAKIPELRVTSRSSAFLFKGKNVDLSEISKKLNVQYILEGSVRHAGNQVRITAQLIDARSDTHVWSKTYDRELQNIFQIQDDIAESVVSELQVSLFGDSSERHPVPPEAYRLYLQGRHFFHLRGRENFEKSIEAFRAALEIEPDYALAWVGTAYTITWQSIFIFRAPIDGYMSALQAIDRAISLDGSLSEAFVGRALIKTISDWDWPAAVEAINKAKSLEPNSLSVNRAVASLLERLGYFEEASILKKRLFESDPMNLSARKYYAYTLLRLGRYDEAEAEIQLVHDLAPDRWFYHRDMGQLNLLRSQFQAAKLHFESETNEVGRLHGLAMADFSLGRQEDAEHSLQSLIDKHSNHWAFLIAEVYAWRGETDQAFYWLEKARELRNSPMHRILVTPFLVRLKDDTRWEGFLETVGLSSTQRASLRLELALEE